MGNLGVIAGGIGAVVVGAAAGTMLHVALPSAASNPNSALVTTVCGIGALALATKGGAISASLGGLSLRTGGILGAAGMAVALGAGMLLNHSQRDRTSSGEGPTSPPVEPEIAPTPSMLGAPELGLPPVDDIWKGSGAFPGSNLHAVYNDAVARGARPYNVGDPHSTSWNVTDALTRAADGDPTETARILAARPDSKFYGDGNGKASYYEMVMIYGSFDADNDGMLTTDHRASFDAVFPHARQAASDPTD